MVTLGEHEEADGEAWHLPAAEPLTGRRFAEMVFAEVGGPPKVAMLSKPMTRLIGAFVPPLQEFPEIWYQYDRPFFADASKFQEAFGPLESTPHEAAVARTIAWFRSQTERRAA